MNPERRPFRRVGVEGHEKKKGGEKLSKLVEANQDIVERSVETGVTVWEDCTGELNVSCMRAVKTDLVSANHGIVIVVESETGKIVGLTLMDFRDWAFKSAPPLEETYRRYRRARSEGTKFDRGLKFFLIAVAAAVPELIPAIEKGHGEALKRAYEEK